jgi:hypothetical protein
MPNWEDDIVVALTNLGGSSSYEKLYSEIERIRPDLPPTWQAIIRRRIQDLSSDSVGFKSGADLFFSVEGLGAGVWGLRAFVRNTPLAIDLPSGNERPDQVIATTYRILRDTELTRKIKLLHRNQCQICGQMIHIQGGATYSEAHHIKPLGAPHLGPDKPENILVLCPNHHVLCDYGATTLQLDQIRAVEGHWVSQEYLDYHNAVIVGRGSVAEV